MVFEWFLSTYLLSEFTILIQSLPLFRINANYIIFGLAVLICPFEIAYSQPGQQIPPLVRLPSNTLLKYTAYKDVSILHFRVPIDTRTAFFTFKAYEESKSAFQRVCEPRDITLHLKAGSYPVISPENITFPKHFLNADQRFPIHHLQFTSDGTTKRLSLDGPHPGNWFAVAFITWTDPNNDRIEQQGLAASCETLLLSEMSVARIIPIIINGNADGDGTDIQSHHATIYSNVTEPISYKFFVPHTIRTVTWKLNVLTVSAGCSTSMPTNQIDCSPDIVVHIQANGLPNAKEYIDSAVIPTNQTGEFILNFYPQHSAWHYVDVNFVGLQPLNETGGGDNSTVNKNDTVTMDSGVVHEVDISVSLIYHSEENSNVEVSGTEAEPEKRQVDDQRIVEYYPLLRQTYREFFMFDYDLLPDVNGTVPAYLNLTAGILGGFRFEVGDVYDIGGTLSFAVAIRDTIKEVYLEKRSTGPINAIAEKLVDSTVVINEPKQIVRSNQTIIICMRLNEPGIPLWPNQCVYGRHILPAASIVNNTNEDTSTGLIHVPFPESGQWFVTMGLFCHGAETAARNTIIESVKEFIRQHRSILKTIKSPCACTNHSIEFFNCISDRKCLDNMTESDALKVKECLMDIKCTNQYKLMANEFDEHHRFATEQSVATDSTCNASAVFTISSSPCVAGRCGRYGRCYHYMSGGFVFSTCLCIKGYRGWDCTEDSQVPSSFSILLALLLLTLSNLLFIPSIYFAIRRKYYTESIIYFFAMFFSIFYHACDSGEDEYSFCLVKIGVLQFCDFYCGLLAIWVTLIAMSHIRQTFVSILHMFGAIMLAFGTELNKQSLWVFLAPALTGLCIISVSWGWRCRRTRKWFPARKYLAIFMPVGMVLVMIGLVCYAFLQTKQNYHIVHSIWHMVMALSILCLLPSRRSFLPKC